jgi:hypothetical protein
MGIIKYGDSSMFGGVDSRTGKKELKKCPIMN